MRKLLIRSCLIAGLTWTYSCASNKETAPQAPAPVQPFSLEPNRPGGPIRHPGLPLRRQQEILPEDENEESAPGPAVLPGDFRPGLRTPRLPETLLYDLDGKLITPSAP